MSMTWIEFAILLGVPLGIGLSILRLLDLQEFSGRADRFAHAYVHGSLATGILAFSWLLFGGAPARMIPGIVGSCALLVCCAVAGRKTIARRERARARRPGNDESVSDATTLRGGPRPPSDRETSIGVSLSRQRTDTPRERVLPWRVLLLFTTGLGLARMIAGTMRPITSGDEANIWAAKAKAIFVSGGFTPQLGEFLRNPNVVAHADYPQWNPLLQVWTFALAGGITHLENRFPIALFFPVLCCMLIAEARRLRSTIGTWMVALYTCSSVVAEMSTQANADVMSATGGACAVISWRRFEASSRASWLGTTALALAATAWAKNEGMLLACGIVLGIAAEPASSCRSLARFAMARCWLPATFAVALVAAQFGFNSRFALANDILENGVDGSSFFERAATRWESAATIARAFLEHGFLALRTTGGVHLLALAIFATRWRDVSRRSRLESIAASTFLGGLFLVYLGTPHDLAWHIETSIDRLLMQIAPIGILAAIRLTGGDDPTAHTTKTAKMPANFGHGH